MKVNCAKLIDYKAAFINYLTQRVCAGGGLPCCYTRVYWLVLKVHAGGGGEGSEIIHICVILFTSYV